MQHSCEYVSIPTVTEQLFVKSVSLAVALNAEFVPPFEAPAALYIRPLALGTGAQLNIIPPTEFKFCVFVQPTAALLGHASAVDVLIVEEFDRAAPRGTGSAKIGGNYAPVMRWQRQAKQEGFGLTLHLDSRTQSEIEEFSAAGFIGVKKSGAGYKLVVPDSASVIKSVTSDTCVQLANALGWEVETRPVSPFLFLARFTLTFANCSLEVKCNELSDFNEVLAVGTAAIVVPIRSIVRKSTSEVFTYDSEDTGKCFKILFEMILKAQRGEEASTSHWNLAVHAPE